jgi:hypothetical protein
MTVTIEVANDAGGARSTKRTVLHSDDYSTPEELEAAAVEFIRASCTANEGALESYLPEAASSSRT